jgi:hypothetical protein
VSAHKDDFMLPGDISTRTVLVFKSALRMKVRTGILPKFRFCAELIPHY